MPYRPTDDTLAASKKAYYRKHQDQSPQSTWSKVLETVGLDEPFAPDSGSYDYRQQAWDESVAAGNPDMSWFLPEVPSDVGNALDGALQYIPDTARGIYDTISDPDKVDDPLVRDYLARRDEILSAFRQQNGRDPTPREFHKNYNEMHDPRSRGGRAAGAALQSLYLPLLGFNDEATAAAMSVLPGRGTYDEELANARRIQGDYLEHEDPYSGLSIASMGAGLLADFGGPLNLGWRGTTAAIGAGRKALGLAPEAEGILGNTLTASLAGGADLGTDLGIQGFGSGTGDAKARLENIDPEIVEQGLVSGAIGGPVYGAGLGLVRGGRAVARGAKMAAAGAKRLAGSVRKKIAPDFEKQATPDYTETRAAGGARPWQRQQGDGSIRDAINRAFAEEQARRAAKSAGSVGASAPLAAMALGGAAVAPAAMNEMERRRKAKMRGY